MRRTTTYAVGTLMIAGVLITGLIIGGRAGRHTPPAAVGTASPSLSIAKPPAPKSPVTSAAIVYRLKQILPPGTTSDYGRAGNGTAFGQIALDRGHGPGMVRLHVGTLSIPYRCVAEAVAIADDPGWGLTMDSALVAAAQQEFPDLPRTFNN